MNIYKRKIQFKYLLFLGAIMIGFGSLWYTSKLVEKLAYEERKKVELWAKATSLIPNTDIEGQSLDLLLNVIENNETVPVILVSSDDKIIQHRNLDTLKTKNPKYLEHKLQEMKEENNLIEINISDGTSQYLYYSQSIILQKLKYYPFVQLTAILLFILVAYFAFSSSRKAEQNQVWVGLSKETAHQLGTPISSLLAWIEVLRMKSSDEQLVDSLDQDIRRLEKITERFSKIGSQPKLVDEDVIEIVENAMEYLKSRSSDKIVFNLGAPDVPVIIPLNAPLFEWVIENTCKNAMDAIETEGTINISISDYSKYIFIDIADTGKGIPRSKFKTIFKPGFTTKDRGWGLGLSLSKRIIEEYHKGKIFIANSEIGKGTTIRIILNNLKK